MRVFDSYFFNIINKVKFKDTKVYLDDMLAKLGLSYQEVSFTFKRFLTTLDKVMEKYPNLEKYLYNYFAYREDVLTTLTPEWSQGEIYADREDWDAIFAVVSKIPRGFNIIPTLVLDKIDWYGDGVREAALRATRHTEGKPLIYMNCDVINSQIIMERQYDHGNKFNIVHVVIETTAEDEPRDTTEILKKLEPFLGQPHYHERECRFSAEENKIFEQHLHECSDRLEAMIEEFYPRREHDYMKEVPFIPNLADKKKIKAAFKETDFVLGDRKGLLPGMNRVICIDSHNYRFEILFDRTQSSSDYFYFYVYVSGCNFRIQSRQHTIFCASEQEAVEMISKIAEFCMDMKAELGTLLGEKFGDTPKWYIYN